MTSLSIVVVAYGGDVLGVLDALAGQRRPGDQVIVVDNLASEGGTAGVRGHRAVDVLLEPAGNLDYSAGANLGAERAEGDVVVHLNPDAVPAPGALDALRAPPEGWSAWGALVALADGEHINNGGGVVHFLGLAWSGRFGEPVSAAGSRPYETGFLSGACLAVRREVWRELGGYAPGYGAYHEDTELSLRLRLAGHRFGVLPAARVLHDYDFDRGPRKWRRLEANRWRTVVRTYPAPVLARVLPLLVLAEAPLVLAAWRGGWLRSKLEAYADLLRWLPAAPAERRAVQETLAVAPAAFAQGLVAGLDSPFLGPAGHPAVSAVLRAVWSALRLGLARHYPARP